MEIKESPAVIGATGAIKGHPAFAQFHRNRTQEIFFPEFIASRLVGEPLQKLGFLIGEIHTNSFRRHI